ncbi:flagellar basal body rod protein FlgC [Sphingorhabdus sp. M41]|uniref:flagellar basal body rod protein FlgC n=1 Tax=Sphingorhabdus sp. M41 TaxID=1806885 RepID=UPI00078E0A80|nr:flagellar basal body rod protein FlgC [Sphingorhabdus sp. M41]AMO72620.1 flagellar basal-body rod protein FlgC [Sphingorhabdus sp. M41]
MSGELDTSLTISASGLKAQSTRMRVIAENLANADSTASEPGGDPYRRRVVDFRAELGRADSVGVKVNGVETDRSDFRRIHQPGHPAADAAGYVSMPNVNALVEAADMKAAQRSYEANLNAIEAARAMLSRTVDLLR